MLVCVHEVHNIVTYERNKKNEPLNRSNISVDPPNAITLKAFASNTICVPMRERCIQYGKKYFVVAQEVTETTTTTKM